MFARKRLVLMHHKEPTSPTLEGLLMGRSHGEYVLRVAKLKQDDETTYPLDGEVRIPKGNVAFFQRLD